MTKKPAPRTRRDRRPEALPVDVDAAKVEEPSPAGVAALIAEGFRPTLHAQIHPDPQNPRQHFDDEGLAELQASIVRDDLLEPLVIRSLADEPDAWMLIAGERRWRAIGLAIEAGDWPADKPIPCMLREVSEQDARRLALVENLQRRDLNAVEEARALQQLAELTGCSAAQIGRDLGFTERWAQQRLSLLKLPDVMQRQVESGTITVQDGREAVSLLPKLPPIKQIELREGKITVAAAKAWVATRPQPLELADADQLALLELAWAIAANRGAARYTDTPVDCSYRKSPLVDGSGLWTVNRSQVNGHDRAVVGFAGWDHLRAITGSDSPLVRELLEAHLRKARTLALAGNPLSADYDAEAFKKVDALYKAKRYVTEWLNGPFKVDPQWQEQRRDAERQNRERAEVWNRERREDEEARERERLEARAGIDAELAAGVALLDQVLGLEGDAGGLGEILQAEGYVGPFRVADDDNQPTIVDATGKVWRHRACGLEALRRMMALSLNLVLGYGATSGPPIENAFWTRTSAEPPPAAEFEEDEPAPRYEFERMVANILADDMECGERTAAQLATRGIDAFLQKEAIAYGAAGFVWDYDGAMTIGELVRLHGLGQQLDLEEAIEAAPAEPAFSPTLLALAGVHADDEARS